MPMEGSSEEYEKLTLASLKKAASPDSDATYHNNRAAIFASLASAAASSEMAEALNRLAGTAPADARATPPARTSAVTPVPTVDGQGNGRSAGSGTPGKELVRRESA